MAHDVFVSYASQDKPVADALCAALEGSRIRCWIAPRDVLPDVPYTESLIGAITHARIMVLVFSSSANSSPMVEDDVRRATAKGIPIVLFRIEDVAPSQAMEPYLPTALWLDAVLPPLERHLTSLAEKILSVLVGGKQPSATGRATAGFAAGLVDFEEAKKRLGKTDAELEEMRKKGEIRAFKDGPSWKFRKEDVDRLAGTEVAAETWIAADTEGVFPSEEAPGEEKPLGVEEAMAAPEAEPAPLALSPETDESGLQEVLSEEEMDEGVAGAVFAEAPVIEVDAESDVVEVIPYSEYCRRYGFNKTRGPVARRMSKIWRNCKRALFGGKIGPLVSDEVTFTVTAPAAVQPRESFVINVWAHLQGRREEVIRWARDAVSGGRISAASKGPVELARGTVVTVRLTVADLVVDVPEDTILWQGEIGNATFPLRVPDNVEKGAKAGSAVVYVAGFRIAIIHFIIQVSEISDRPSEIASQQERHRKAFVSYSSADRDEVLARIHGMQKAAPDTELFLDKACLRSGQYWERELMRVIPQQDVFYLFWSHNAALSEWVDKEWRCALEMRGIDFIDPVPLEPPEVAPPPQELSGKHFDDWVLAYKRTERNTA